MPSPAAAEVTAWTRASVVASDAADDGAGSGLDRREQARIVDGAEHEDDPRAAVTLNGLHQLGRSLVDVLRDHDRHRGRADVLVFEDAHLRPRLQLGDDPRA